MSRFRKQLFATTFLCGLLATQAGAAHAQQSAEDPSVAEVTSDEAAVAAAAERDADEANGGGSGEEIVVTGSILRRTSTETPSPVTIVTAESMEQRGINTVSEALQRLSANGSGTISEGWNNGFNFAQGATAISLRGLTVQKTLTIFDGMRMAPYPLADDGHRNFVDIGTIPDAIVERIEILRDGASSTYGADAVAGVVNVITKKEIQGVHINASRGISGRGDGGERQYDITAGYGDLDDQGFNVYVNATYRKKEEIWARDRGFPWNSGFYSKICNDSGSCMSNPSRWSIFAVNADGSLGGSTVPLAPIVAPLDGAGTRTGEFRLLNSDCGAFNSFAVQLPNSARAFNQAGTLATWAASQCSADLKDQYATLRPETSRYGFSARATVRVGEAAEAYIAGNFMQADTNTQLAPLGYNGQTAAPGVVVFNPIILPVYVCATGVGTINRATGQNTSTGCNAGNGILNPNNPFAAAGQEAQIRGRYDRPTIIETATRALRAAAGITGSFGSDDEWNYQVEAVASGVRLKRTSENYLIPQRLADVIANGRYNFAQPWLNSEEVRDYIAPVNVKTSTSNLWQVSGTLSRAIVDLPGGPLQVAIGAARRHEALNDPSANPANDAHPYDRYYTINAVGAVGSRNVTSGYFEIDAPILDNLEANLSGRYDKYSSGQKNFSPKVGVKFTPMRELSLRGTWSRGFRIPSFNEAYGLPTTGYVTQSINCGTQANPGPLAAFCQAHGWNPYSTGQYSLGLTSTGNPSLDSEKSRSFTAGLILEPTRKLSFTVDYFNIKVKDLIGGISAASQTAALNAYILTGETRAVPGVVIVPGIPDPQFPNARPLPQSIEYSFQNSSEENVSGIDMGANFSHDFGPVRLTSTFDASHLLKYSVTREDGTVERYDGTLSPCHYTSCSGSPKWRGSWQNTFAFGDVSVTATVYYVSGYDLASIDDGAEKGDCQGSIGRSVVTYRDGTPVKCQVGAQWNADLAGTWQIREGFTLYANVLNFLDIKPKFDPSGGYSLYNYNPAWGQPNIVGRYFRLGAKVSL